MHQLRESRGKYSKSIRSRSSEPDWNRFKTTFIAASLVCLTGLHLNPSGGPRGNGVSIMAAGADVLVAGNTVFKSADPKGTIHQLKQL